MAPAFTLVRARSLRGALLCSLLAGALALLTPSTGIAVTTDVMTCRPWVQVDNGSGGAGQAPTVKLSPALVPPPDAAKYGYKLATTLNGCAANAQQLTNWGAVKRGTPDGALIAQAELSLALTGFDNCTLGLVSQPVPGAYEAVGKLQLKWLDANGDKIKSAKATTAFIHLVPLTQTFVGLSSYGEGVVTSGLGLGATVQVTLPIPMSFLTNQRGDFVVCAAGGFIPGETQDGPRALKSIPLSARPVVKIFFPDPLPN